MRAAPWRAACVLGAIALSLVAGCGGSREPDSNTKVFETVEQARIRRRAELVANWQKTAISVLRVDRPDMKAAPAEPCAITISADGQETTVDLSGLEPALIAPAADERQIIREHLQKQLAVFAQQRLAGMSFDKVRPLLLPRLMSVAEAAQLGLAAGQDVSIRSTSILGEFGWAPVVHWPGGNEWSAITTKALAAWKVKPEAVDEAALANLRGQLKPEMFRTTPFEPLGRVGNLNTGGNPAVMLLPEFLPTVRKMWKTDDDLVIFVGGRQDLSFLERNHERLLDMIYRSWLTRATTGEGVLCRQPFLLSDKGLAPLNYSPASTKPATAPKPATQTRPYIVLPG